MSRKPKPQEDSLYVQVLATCVKRHPSIGWDFIERELNGQIAYKLTGVRGEIATSERIDGNQQSFAILAGAEVAADVVAERIARLEKKSAA